MVAVGDTAALISYVNSEAPSYGLDPAAVLAVAKQEGWGGTIGDGGEAYGPWQDWLTHFPERPWYGSGTNNQQVQAWAWSTAGINYVLGQMASSGAKGKTGLQAIQAITQNFEKPAEPAQGGIGWWQEAQNAWNNAYASFKNGSAVGTSGTVSTVDPSLDAGAQLVSAASAGTEATPASSSGGGTFTLVPGLTGPGGLNWPGIKISTGALWASGFFILAGLLIIAGLILAFRRQIEATAASAARGVAGAAA